MAFIVGEIGINHNGDVNNVLKIIELAKRAGFSAVKFQKRNPELYPERPYNSPIIGECTYRKHKRALELNLDDYTRIDNYCMANNIEWFASCFDIESVDFIKQFKPTIWKIASPVIHDLDLISYIAKQDGQVFISSGMSTESELMRALTTFENARMRIKGDAGRNDFVLLHCCSEYPTPVEHVNLNMITMYKKQGFKVGYSSHDSNVVFPVTAVALGATVIEVHITLDRSMKGSDQSASLEWRGMETLVRHVQSLEIAMGSDRKQFYEGEQKIRDKVMKK